MTSVPQRATAKYGSRGYRMALLEAGHASQNLCLAAQGLGLGSLVYGAYYDDELAALLDIDGVTETVVSVMLLGRDAPQEAVAP
jgi:SagB-type dehydrogenase family enzyme